MLPYQYAGRDIEWNLLPNQHFGGLLRSDHREKDDGAVDLHGLGFVWSCVHPATIMNGRIRALRVRNR
jgi:hypothetical protein